MFRCPPSKIQLLPGEVLELDHRLDRRHSIPPHVLDTTTVRLNAGPGRSTTLALVHKDHRTKESIEHAASPNSFSSLEFPGSTSDVQHSRAFRPSRAAASASTAVLLPTNATEVPTYGAFQRPFMRQAGSGPQFRAQSGRTTTIFENATSYPTNPILNPGAPIFVPRIRLASAVQTAYGNIAPRTASMETESDAESRFRSASPSQTLMGRNALLSNSPRKLNTWAVNRLETQSARSTQNDRQYPHDTTRPSHSSITTQGANSYRTIPLRALDTSGTLHNPDSLLRPLPNHHDAVPRARSTSSEQYSHPLGTISSTPSIISGRSTPNLLCIPYHDTRMAKDQALLSSDYLQSRRTSSNRAMSMVSAASGASGSDMTLHEPINFLDAEEELLRRHHSPLDELTQRISRLRSVGHSWERTSEQSQRVSLLSGDPFRSDVYALPSTSIDETSWKHDAKETNGETVISAEDRPTPGEIDLTLSPHLSLSSTPVGPRYQVSSSTPLMNNDYRPSTRSPLKQISPGKSALRCPIATRPTRTPRMRVYNDSQDTNGSSELASPATRHHGTYRRLNAAEQQVSVARRYDRSENPNTSDQGLYRGDVPRSMDSQSSTAAVTLQPTRDHVDLVDRVQNVSPRTRARRRRAQTENDLATQLPDLGQDGRTWLSRHAAGTMDITPPREGRFERYLS